MDQLRNAILADWPHTSGFASALAVMSVLDVILGVIVAFIARQVSSTVSRMGIARKCAVGVFVAACIILDSVLPSFPAFKVAIGSLFVIEGPSTLAGIVSLAFMLTEVISLMEKCVMLKIPVPKWIKIALLKARAKMDNPFSVADESGK